MQTLNQDVQVNEILDQPISLPEDPQKERIVLWKVFRSKDEAVEYSQHVLLEPTQRIVGGYWTDSAGGFFWLGVQVDDLGKWGNSQAIQLTDPFDSNDPVGQGRGPGSN